MYDYVEKTSSYDTLYMNWSNLFNIKPSLFMFFNV